MPRGTFVAKYDRVVEVLDVILSQSVVQYTDKDRIRRILKNAVEIGADEKIRNGYVSDIHDILGKDRVFD